MKKKTLVSVLAMTSASMAAYANANLDQIKTEVDQWVGWKAIRLADLTA